MQFSSFGVACARAIYKPVSKKLFGIFVGKVTSSMVVVQRKHWSTAYLPPRIISFPSEDDLSLFKKDINDNTEVRQSSD